MAINNINDWARTVLHGLGIHPTSANMQAMVGWAKAEGGHYNNSARFNPLNTTQPEPGAGNTGSQGNIKVYKSWDQGVKATIDTLRNGRYGPIIAALRGSDPTAVARAIGRTPWGTSAQLVQSAISGAPSNLDPAGPTGATRTNTGAGRLTQGDAAQRTLTTTTPGVNNSAARASLIQSFLEDKRTDPVNFALSIRGLRDVPATTSSVTGPVGPPGATPTARAAGATPRGGAISPHARPGDPVVSSRQSEGGLHQTSGLSGYPAHDFMAPAGTHAVAPVTGKVFKLSGHDPSLGAVQGAGGPLGWSVYIEGDDGRKYFMTHLGSRNVKVGQRVRQGQVIGTVANYDKYGRPSHIHLGVSD